VVTLTYGFVSGHLKLWVANSETNHKSVKIIRFWAGVFLLICGF